MRNEIRVDRLANHPECLPLIRQWFEDEWPSYYGPNGQGDAAFDVRSYASDSTLPVGIVAFRDGELCGVAALKADSVSTRSDLTPWAGAGFVLPSLRRRGIGARLLGGVEQLARELGFARIYCATSTSASLLERNAWRFMERISHVGELLAIYEKAL
jgi:GNAT superfamily N-acetyltransferase